MRVAKYLAVAALIQLGSGAVVAAQASEGPRAAVATPTSAQSVLRAVPSAAVKAVQYVLRVNGYAVAIDGVYGPQTTKAVLHWQRANGLVVDGVVGPQTLDSLGLGATATAQAVRVDPPVTGAGPDVARQALRDAGATDSEVEFGVRICERESHCTLSAVNQNRSTGDNSWGPWQVNYFGNLYAGRAALVGEPSTNTESWPRAARNFLVFLRAAGRCHWEPPRYCG